MKKLLLCALFAALATTGVLAQYNDSGSKNKDKDAVRTITGCLTQGDNAKEFLLTESNGSTWEMHDNSTANLSSHLNQQVSVTGAVSNPMAHNLKEDAKDTAADTGMKKNNTEHGHLKPTDVQKVSESCSK